MSFRIGLNIVRHNLRRNISNSLSMRSVRQYNTENNTQKQKLGERLIIYYLRIGTICGGSAGIYTFFIFQRTISQNEPMNRVCSGTLEYLFQGVLMGIVTGLCWPVIPIGTATYYYRKYYPLQLSESSKSSESSESSKSSKASNE